MSPFKIRNKNFQNSPIFLPLGTFPFSPSPVSFGLFLLLQATMRRRRPSERRTKERGQRMLIMLMLAILPQLLTLTTDFTLEKPMLATRP